MFFEDVSTGERFTLGSTTVTEESIVTFARAFDPQPMHLDPAWAGASRFGSVIASGWHTTALAMRMMVDAGMLCGDGAIGIGADTVRWHRVVRPGDTLSLELEIVRTEAPANGGRGRVEAETRLRDEGGHVVFSMMVTVGLALRHASVVRNGRGRG